MRSIREIVVADSVATGALGIAGLTFEPNGVRENTSIPMTKVYSNTGDIIGHFVTHAPDFRYVEYGIHVGQTDRLTFVASSPRTLTGSFIDCREDSPTVGMEIKLVFAASPARKLIIPNGVAHTFENLGDVVTRNDMHLFCDPANPQWRAEDDNITFPVDIALEDIPRVRANRHALPFSAAILLFRMQQELLRGGREDGSKTVDTTIDGKKRTVVATRKNRSRPLLMPGTPLEGHLPGFGFSANSYFAIADDSWGILPGTRSCVMDLVVFDLDSSERGGYTVHTRHDLLHTFLDRMDEPVVMELIDLRRDSARFGDKRTIAFTCDPRVHLRIPAGVGYRYRGDGRFAVRFEYQLFVDEREPRKDLPPVGADHITVDPRHKYLREGVVTPKLPAPEDALWFLLRQELEVIGALGNLALEE